MKPSYRVEDLKLQFESRKNKGGEMLWSILSSLYHRKEKLVSGIEAMYFKNAYNLSPDDVVFLCESHGCKVDLMDFIDRLNG